MRDVSLAEEVCFGTLKNVPIILVQYEGELEKIEAASWGPQGDNRAVACLELAFAQRFCEIRPPSSEVTVAMLNRRTHSALACIERSQELTGLVRYRALLPLTELRRRLKLASQPFGLDPSLASWHTSILVSGRRSISELLARTLSQQRLFLQHPGTVPDDMCYENPQYLKMVGSSLSNGAVLAPIISGANAETDDTEDTGQAHVTHQELKTQDLDDVVNAINLLDHLPQHHYLMEPQVDGRIKTALLPHQKAGVDFIIRRESAEELLDRPHSLWRVEPQRLNGYRHTISGIESSTPVDILGGMLADDMGLGKTLTMIATIVTTFSQAEQHMATPLSGGHHSPKNLIPVKSTLVIVPSTLLLDGWVAEITKHVTSGTLSYHKYHGPGRVLPSASPLPYHVVLTTYSTVTADFRRGGGVLECFHWYRIILDEGHVIRNSATKQFQAVMKLASAIRWCMTGTPIQNSISDLGSLVKFLRVPFLEESSVFGKYIVGRQTQGIFMRKTETGNLKLLVSSICLRRSRLILPSFLEPVSKDHRLEFSSVERRAYEDIAQNCRRAIDAVVSNKRTKRGNNMILTGLLSLRIFCNTGLLTRNMSDQDSEDFLRRLYSDEIISLFQQRGDATCSTCGTDVDSLDPIGVRALARGTQMDCLKLRCHDYTTEANVEQVDSADQHRDGLEVMPVAYPSKLQALRVDIQEHQEQEKSIVFSFWKRSLRLVSQLLDEHGISSLRVDGDLSPKQRKEALAKFRDMPDIRVLLMTIGTGAVGLNDLSVASRVHILEPQWNPSTESQAIGRVLRLGQRKKVTIVRYIVKKSIEESVESRQMMKVQLALKGGLRSSDTTAGNPSAREGQSHQRQRWMSSLQELDKMIEATILPEEPVEPVGSRARARGRKRPREGDEEGQRQEGDTTMDWTPE